MLTLNKITQSDQLVALTPQWHDLIKRAYSDQIFLTPEFLISWWQAYGHGELISFAFFDQQQLIGFIPTFICSDDQTLKLIGCKDVSDYLDFLVDQRYSDQVFKQLAKELNKTSINSIELCSLPQDSLTLTAFQQQMVANGWQAQLNQQDVCPIIKLPTSWEAYLQSLDRKQRHEIKRKWKKLNNEQKLEFEILTSKNEVEQSIDEFISLHQKSSVDKERFWNNEHRQFFTDLSVALARTNNLKLFYAKVNGERVATMLIFDYNNNYYLYNSGFNPDQYASYGVGNILTSFTIQDAIENGKKIYDFLRGDEKYKYRFGAFDTKVFDLKLTKRD